MTGDREHRLATARRAPWLARGISLLFSLLVLLLAEGATRLLVPGTHLEAILSLLEQDADLLWRQRPGLDATFRGKAVRTDGRGMRLPSNGQPLPAGEAPAVVCMGASPTFGFGVRYEEAYPHQLELRLQRATGRPLRVSNAGMVGHTTHQGLLLLGSEILALRPRIITLGYVLNDLDRYRFFRSDGRADQELERQGALLVWVHNALGRSAFFRLLTRLLSGAVGRGDAGAHPSLQVHPPLSVRVPLSAYRRNLGEMITLARRNGIAVVLLKMPVNLPAEEPVSGPDRRAAAELLARGVELARRGDCGSAVPLLKKALAHRPSVGLAHYYLGSCARAAGDHELAARYLDETMRSEARRCGSDARQYNRAMEQISREMGVPLVDVVAAFARRKEYLFVDPREDPTHPGPQGHRLIADLLAETILACCGRLL